MDLKDKVMVITGASSGIGMATARRLNRAGVKFVLNARSQDKLEALASELDKAVCVTGDMVAPETSQQILDATLSEFGRVDIVFNNAGVMHIGSIEEVDIEVLCDMVRLNFESVVRMSYLALRQMKKQESGFLINSSSLAGLKAFAQIGPYCGTKFAVEALTDALRMELAGTGIKVAAIEPGRTKTELFSHWPDEKKFKPENGLIEADDIARCIEFILVQPQEVLIPRMVVVPARQER